MNIRRKLSAMFLALVLMMSTGIAAFAADGSTGSMEIKNAVMGQTYTVYRVFDLEMDQAKGAYKYSLSEKWKSLRHSEEFGTYFTVDHSDYVEQKADFDAAGFAAFLSRYQKSANIPYDGQKLAQNRIVTFEGLPFGYYFTDTTLGSVCALNTTSPNAEIEEKNSAPTLDKQVQEDSDGAWGDLNDAEIGQTVAFRTTIQVSDGKPENYVLHDQMSDGLTFAGITGVKVNEQEIGTEVSDGAYYEQKEDIADGCTLELQFYHLNPGDTIEVTYEAVLNDRAVIAGDGNYNRAKLTYGKSDSTAWDQTVTSTWEIPIFKYTGENKPLAGAEFVLYNADRSKVAILKNGRLAGWETPETDENGNVRYPDGSVLISAEDGRIAIGGLDADTYELEEIKAPAGYNKLTKPVPVTITSVEEDHAAGAVLTQNGGQTPVSQIAIENHAGMELPDTGGIGTTVFYVIGGVLAAGALALLVIRYRREKSGGEK